MKINNWLIISLLSLIILSACKKDEVLDASHYGCVLPFVDSSSTNPNQLAYQSVIDEISASGVPGIQLAIQTPAEGLWLGASGMADLKNQVELEPCNLTRVGSTVKMFTSVTVLLLQEEGKLSLDDLAADYLTADEIKGLKNAEKATIRQLLQHSSGIYNYIVNLNFQTASLNDLIKTWSPDDLLRYARGKQPNFAPGEDVQYSNTNYVLLGMIIGHIEGKPFYEVFEEKIFTPLGLTATRFAANDPVPERIIQGYVDFYSNLNVINATQYSGWDYYTADGGLLSNATDLNRFMTALFSGEVLSTASLAEMTTGITPSFLDPGFFDLQYGLGIFKMETPYGPAYFHSGDAIGYYANVAYFPASETTIAWAVNGNYGKIDQYVSSKAAMENIFGTVFD